MDLDLVDTLLRLGGATTVGALFGINRDLEGKAIGVRTLGLVALGAAAMTVATIEVPGIAENPDSLSRVVQGLIQGIMAGIGFLGAGVIMRNKDTRTVEGLTTAATVWVTAAMGVACGLGQWKVVAVSCVIALVLLVVVPWLEKLLGLDGD